MVINQVITEALREKSSPFRLWIVTCHIRLADGPAEDKALLAVQAEVRCTRDSVNICHSSALHLLNAAVPEAHVSSSLI